MSNAAERIQTLRTEQSERRASGNFITKADLDRIVVLWRQPDLLALWGIPYAMRESCQQTPKHLWDARHSFYEKPIANRTYARRNPTDLSDWIWLGQCGWWGSLLPEERTAIEVWLSPLEMLGLVPKGPCEFVDLRKEFRGQTYDEAVWGKRPTAKIHPELGHAIIPGMGLDDMAIVRV
jgi:hypothetical protein